MYQGHIFYFEKYRSNRDEGFNLIFKQSEIILKSLNVEVVCYLPRLVGRQKYRNFRPY